jgi:hypothetical protein
MWLRFRDCSIAMGVQLELVAQYPVCRLAPNRDVEPQETIATLTQRRQFSKIAFTNARRNRSQTAAHEGVSWPSIRRA